MAKKKRTQPKAPHTILTGSDQSKINRIIMEAVGDTARFVRIENRVLRFNLFVGEKKALKACKALIKKKLQHKADDGKSEFTLNGAEGAMKVEVEWPLDLSKPLWGK